MFTSESMDAMVRFYAPELPLPPVVMAVLYRLLRDASTSTIKEEGAKSINVTAAIRPGLLVIDVEFDGLRSRGSSPNRPILGREAGLAKTQPQAEMLGGSRVAVKQGQRWREWHITIPARWMRTGTLMVLHPRHFAASLEGRAGLLLAVGRLLGHDAGDGAGRLDILSVAPDAEVAEQVEQLVVAQQEGRVPGLAKEPSLVDDEGFVNDHAADAEGRLDSGEERTL